MQTWMGMVKLTMAARIAAHIEAHLRNAVLVADALLKLERVKGIEPSS